MTLGRRVAQCPSAPIYQAAKEEDRCTLCQSAVEGPEACRAGNDAFQDGHPAATWPLHSSGRLLRTSPGQSEESDRDPFGSKVWPRGRGMSQEVVETVFRFVEDINRQQVEKLEELMTEERRFVDPSGVEDAGRTVTRQG